MKLLAYYLYILLLFIFMLNKKYVLLWLVVLIILSSGCDKPVKTTDLLYVDYLKIYPSNILNTNIFAQIRMRIINSGQSPAKMVLDERKIKVYYLWEEKKHEEESSNNDISEYIFREGDSWFKWNKEEEKVTIKNYVEYILEDDGTGVTLIDSEGQPNYYEINPSDYLSLDGNTYTSSEDKVKSATKDDLDEEEFKASSVLVRYCRNLYNIEEFIINPRNNIENFMDDIRYQTAGSEDTVYSKSIIIGRQIEIKPKDSVELVWKIKTPSNKETAGLTQPCKFWFNVKYSAKAKSESHIYFANPLEIIQHSVTEKKMNMKGTSVRTYGPMAIKIEPTSKQPIRSSTGTEEDDKNKWTLNLIVLNKGGGYGHIKNMKLKVNKNPEEFFSNIGDEEKGYYCDLKKKNDMLEIDNNDGSIKKIILNKLDIYKDKTSEIRCTIASPIVNIMEPYMFTVTADYDYVLQGHIEVKTKPDREI